MAKWDFFFKRIEKTGEVHVSGFPMFQETCTKISVEGHNFLVAKSEADKHSRDVDPQVGATHWHMTGHQSHDKPDTYKDGRESHNPYLNLDHGDYFLIEEARNAMLEFFNSVEVDVSSLQHKGAACYNKHGVIMPSWSVEELELLIAWTRALEGKLTNRDWYFWNRLTSLIRFSDLAIVYEVLERWA